jgi:protein TonB
VFEDSLFDTTARPQARRGLSAAISFAFQTAILGVLVLIPMVFTNALPVNALKGLVFVSAPTRASTPKAPEPRHTTQATSNFADNQLVQPRVVPQGTHRVVDTQPLESGIGDTGPDIPGAIPLGANGRGTALSVLLNGLPKPSQPHNIAPPKSVRVSGGVIEGLLIHKITPDYPTLARQVRAQGQVILQATIGRDGTIQNLQVVTGHPLLMKSAVQAVRQWRYKPYLLNNEPVEVETQITVNFTLGG